MAKFNWYNWEQYALGYSDGSQDKTDGLRGIDKNVIYNSTREDDEYFDGYMAGFYGRESKFGSDLPCAYYQHHCFEGKRCWYRFMGNDWREAALLYAYVNRGDQIIGWAVLDCEQQVICNIMEPDVVFSLAKLDDIGSGNGGKGAR